MSRVLPVRPALEEVAASRVGSDLVHLHNLLHRQQRALRHEPDWLFRTHKRLVGGGRDRGVGALRGIGRVRLG